MKGSRPVAVIVIALLGTSCAADRGVREEPTRAHGSARGGITGTIKLPDRPLRMAVVPLGGRTTRHVLAVTYVSGGSGFTLAFYDLRTLRKVSPSVGSDVDDIAAADRYVWLKQTSPLDMSARLVRIRATDVVVASDNTSIGNVFPLSTYLPRHIGLPPDTEMLSATREAVWLATTPQSGRWSVMRVDARTLRTATYAVPRGSVLAGLPDGFLAMRKVRGRFVLERRGVSPGAISTTVLRGSWTPVRWPPPVACGRSLWTWVRSASGAVVARAGTASTSRSRQLVTTSRGEVAGPIALSDCRDLWITVHRHKGRAATIYRLDARTLRVRSSIETPPVDSLAAGAGAAWAAIGDSHAVLRIR